ncbi:MAG: RtcB family protein [Caldilineales bacterium]|nr:RtcB family protein [Caldilineales bacterium]
MVARRDLRQLTPFLFEIAQTHRADMRVPARIYADEEIIQAALIDRSLEQLVNTSTLPGIVQYALAMPDIHQGYGFSIGGVVATRVADGVISPGGVGYDINCGVRLLASEMEEGEVQPHLPELATALYQQIPSGVGTAGFLKLSDAQMKEVLETGAKWPLHQGMARREDLAHTEEEGTMPAARADKVSPQAQKRGRDQLGTLGAGNHFAEIDVVDEIFDPALARAFGLFPGQVVLQIHCGSRGLGHQVCTDYVQQFQTAIKKYDIVLPDRQLVCAPVQSPEGQDYLAAMAAAANYAWANRQVLTHQARQAFAEALAGKVRDYDLRLVYDIAHNMAKLERHDVGGHDERVCVHRKGATRAFGPGNPVLPPDYRDAGQPVLVPGSMGTASFVLAGTAGAMAQTFGSTCHGAGRQMSRKEAKRQVHGAQLRNQLQARGIEIRAGSLAGLAEEAPIAYKDVSQVVEVVHNAGIANKVARLRPIAVVKG